MWVTFPIVTVSGRITFPVNVGDKVFAFVSNVSDNKWIFDWLISALSFIWESFIACTSILLESTKLFARSFLFIECCGNVIMPVIVGLWISGLTISWPLE